MTNFAAWPEQATQPNELPAFYRRRWFSAYNFHQSRAEMRGLAELLETLRGHRAEFSSWDSNGNPTAYKPNDLVDTLTNELPVDFLAQCLAVIESGDEAKRLELRELLTAQINTFVEHHAQFQAEHEASREAMEAGYENA